MEAEVDVRAEEQDVDEDEGEEGEEGEDEVRLSEVVAQGDGGEEEQGDRGDELIGGQDKQRQTIVSDVDEDDAIHEEVEEHEDLRVGDREAGPGDHRACQQAEEEKERNHAEEVEEASRHPRGPAPLTRRQVRDLDGRAPGAVRRRGRRFDHRFSGWV